ncbi:biotin carboxylase [Pseudomonas sp. JAI115]|uniref:ATP-grasp domain-containing protein n=1 Tax=Pseudomonas sp. JAI115 TaxID=2723061 RepID=UPI00160CC6D7|nr:ATP-grasp domain-containing protein [Pseudomonas sp. JAI115]MBB6157635.1 biotin carboxylase [Pseudomonas sp. JAI115]
MKNILMVDCTDVSSRAIITAKQIGYNLIFLRTEMTRLFSSLSEEFLIENTYKLYSIDSCLDLVAFEEKVREINEAHPLSVMFTPLEDIVESVSTIAANLGIRATSIEGVKNAKNKPRARALLNKNGLSNCKYKKCVSLDTLHEVVAEIGIPCIVKPAKGFAKFLTAHIKNQQDVDKFIADYNDARGKLDDIALSQVSLDFVVEQYIDGKMYSVEVAKNEHGFFPLMLTERHRSEHNDILEIGSIMAPAGFFPREQEIFDYCEEVLACLSLDIGVFHIEIIVSDKGIDIIEVNPRLMGGALGTLYNKSTSLNVYEILLNAYVGSQIKCRPASALFATARRIAPIESGMAQKNIGKLFIEEHCPWVLEHSINIVEGQEVLPMIDNDTSLGYLHVVGVTYQDSVQKAKKATQLIQRALGVSLSY